MPHFEVYDRSSRNAGRRRGETVTVNRRGYLSFSPDAFARLGSPQAVRCLVDEGERLIGFRPCKPREPDAYAVSPGTRIMSAVALLRHMGVDFEEARRYDLQVEDGLPPYIDLKKPGVPVTSNRRKAVKQ